MQTTQKHTIAIMQPYILPYIGYFQMIKAVDKFIFYDDVNFIKQGWVNRNRVLANGKDQLFAIPVENISSFTPINETLIKSSLYPKWKNKFLKTLKQNYLKAPHFSTVFPLIEQIFNTEHKTISELTIDSIIQVTNYLKLPTEFIIASEKYNNKHLERTVRIIAICQKENATHYINAIGGQELYNKEDFQKEGITLNFIQSNPIAYTQFGKDFIPWLSIIDVLMFNSIKETNAMLDKYTLI